MFCTFALVAAECTDRFCVYLHLVLSECRCFVHRYWVMLSVGVLCIGTGCCECRFVYLGTGYC